VSFDDVFQDVEDVLRPALRPLDLLHVLVVQNFRELRRLLLHQVVAVQVPKRVDHHPIRQILQLVSSGDLFCSVKKFLKVGSMLLNRVTSFRN